MKKHLLLALLLFSVFSLVSAQQEQWELNSLYDTTKSLFLDFEKENGRYIMTQNVQMHYLTWGDPTGVPLIWLHGTYSNSYELYDIAESIAVEGVYLIGIDYYGHGLTPLPAKEVSLYDIADDIDFLMRELSIAEAVIGGWSRGGSIATAFYDAYPMKVKAIILEDGGSVAWDEPEHKNKVLDFENDINAYFSTHEAETTYKTSLEAYSSVIEALEIKNQADVQANKRTLFTSFASLQELEPNKFQFNPFVETLICEDSAENYLDAVHRTYQAKTLFAKSSHLLYPKIVYKNLNVPMLVFDPVSENDWFEFTEENKELADSHPDLITLKVYQDTGHAVKHSHPVKFLADVVAFINLVKR